MKKGVRQQSIASTMFSRIKKAGQRVKSMAASIATGGSNSNKSSFTGAFSWRPGAGKVKGAASGNASGAAPGSASGGASGLSRFQAGGLSRGSGGGGDSMGREQDPGMVLPGQAEGEGDTGTAAGGRNHSHGNHRRSSVDGHGHRRASTDSHAASSHHGSQHHGGHHHHHHGHRRRSQEGQDRRLTGERRRSSIDSKTPSPPPEPRAGPVAESATTLQVIQTGKVRAVGQGCNSSTVGR